MSRWQTFGLNTIFPKRPAVYVIYLDGRLAYIGQSLNVRDRLRRFKFGYAKNIETPWGDNFSSIIIKISYSTRYGDWAMREMRLIRRLTPWANERLLGTECRGRA